MATHPNVEPIIPHRTAGRPSAARPGLTSDANRRAASPVASWATPKGKSLCASTLPPPSRVQARTLVAPQSHASCAASAIWLYRGGPSGRHWQINPRGAQTVGGRGEREPAGLLGRPQYGQGLAVPGPAAGTLEAVDVVRVAVADTDEFARALDGERHLHHRVGNHLAASVDHLHQHVGQIAPAGGERPNVGGEADRGRLAGGGQRLAG